MCRHVLVNTCIMRLWKIFSTREIPFEKWIVMLVDSVSTVCGLVSGLEIKLQTTVATHQWWILSPHAQHCEETDVSSKTSTMMSQLNLNFHLIVWTYCSSWRFIWEWNLGSLWTIFLAAGCQYLTPALSLTMSMIYTNWLF